MKTFYLILIFAYLLPSLIALIRLVLDKETVSFKRFMFYGYWALVPIYNVVMCWYIILEFRAKFKT